MSSSEPAETPATRTNDLRGRGRRGQYTRTLEGAERDAAAARLRSDGYGYPEIAKQLSISISAAHDAVKRALKEVVQEAAEDVRTFEIERLDQILLNIGDMHDLVLRALERRHYTVSNGKVVCLDDVPLEDDGFILQAVDRLNAIETQRIKVQDRRAKLLGLDIPVKQEIDLSGGVEYRIVGVAPEDLK